MLEFLKSPENFLNKDTKHKKNCVEGLNSKLKFNDEKQLRNFFKSKKLFIRHITMHKFGSKKFRLNQRNFFLDVQNKTSFLGILFLQKYFKHSL